MGIIGGGPLGLEAGCGCGITGFEVVACIILRILPMDDCVTQGKSTKQSLTEAMQDAPQDLPLRQRFLFPLAPD
jgi:thioredoxin reductase